MQRAGDPAWTERPQTISEQNMLGTETIRNRRLLPGLLYPLLSDAITLRLRYLSFWPWVLDNHKQLSQSERCRYEKIFLLSMLAHDCPNDDALATNGRVGAERSVDSDHQISDLYDPDSERIDISREAFSLVEGDRCGFDQYHRRSLNRLFLLRGEETLTPIGLTVAKAFDKAVDVEFDEFRSAVAAKEVTTELINRIAPTSCACQISDREKQLLMQAYLGMFDSDKDYTTLSFVDELDFDAFNTLENLLGDRVQGGSLRETEEMSIDELLGEDDSEDQSDIVEYLDRGFGVRMRGSSILFLATAGWTTNPAPDDRWNFESLEEIRSLWRLFVHTEYFVYGCEALLCAVVRAVRGSGPIGRSGVLDRLFDSAEYTRTLRSILGEGVSISRSNEGQNRLREVRNALYYGTWMDTGRDISYTPVDGVGSDPLTWRALYDDLRADGAETAQFNLGTRSEEAMKSLCFQHRDGGEDIKRAPQLAAYVTVLFVRLRQRYASYFGTEEYEPQRIWFQTLETQPSPSLVWSILPEPDADHSIDVQETMRSFTDRWIINQYWTTSHEKIRRSPSRAVRHIEREKNGRYSFETAYRSFSQSNIKFDRLTDFYYELGLTTSPRMDSFAPSERGEAFLEQVGVWR